MKGISGCSSKQIIIFVEGDTDEVFFKALLDYYKFSSQMPLTPCEVINLKGVTRYTSKLLAKLRNEILPEAKRKNTSIQTICCTYDTDVFEVRNPRIVNARLCDLYSKARRIYSKGYTAREMISSLNFSLIRNKRLSSLQELEKALGVQQTPQ